MNIQEETLQYAKSIKELIDALTGVLEEILNSMEELDERITFIEDKLKL
jgi:hypothetical protein